MVIIKKPVSKVETVETLPTVKRLFDLYSSKNGKVDSSTVKRLFNIISLPIDGLELKNISYDYSQFKELMYKSNSDNQTFKYKIKKSDIEQELKNDTYKNSDTESVKWIFDELFEGVPSKNTVDGDLLENMLSTLDFDFFNL